MKNKIQDLRDHLFETIEALKCDKNPMALDRAKVIADVAQVIVNSAKVECDFIRVTQDAESSGFFPRENPKSDPSRQLMGKPLAMPSPPRN